MAVLKYMAGGVFLAKVGRNDGRANQRNVNLSAMRMSGEQQRDTLRKTWKDIRVVSESDDC